MESDLRAVDPLGLAVIVDTSNFVKPEAIHGAIVPALLYLAFWYGQAGVAFWLLGFETMTFPRKSGHRCYAAFVSACCGVM